MALSVDLPMDLIAPAARQPTDAAAKGTLAGEFDEHLEAQAPASDEAAAKPAADASDPGTKDQPAPDVAETAAQAPTPPQQQPAPALTLQLIPEPTAEAAPCEATDQQAATPEQAQTQPVQAAPPQRAQMKPQTATAETPPTQQGQTATSDAAPAVKAEAAEQTSDAKTEQPKKAEASQTQTVTVQTPALAVVQAAAVVEVQAPKAETTAQTDANAALDAIGAASADASKTAAPAQRAHGAEAAAPAPTLEGAPQEALEAAPKAAPRVTGEAAPAQQASQQGAQQAQPGVQLAAPPQAAPPPAAPPPMQLAEQQAHAVSHAPPAATQVAHEIVRKFTGGATQFDLRLDPPELGRVDVRIDVGRDQRVSATISADNPAALTDLARAARDIQQALQSAGLELREDGLQFDLSGRNEGRAFSEARNGDAPSGARGNAVSTDDPLPAARPLTLDRWRGSRVDLVA
jgi:flagellar hook-length control protein FliK